jgi:hypothetical protein
VCTFVLFIFGARHNVTFAGSWILVEINSFIVIMIINTTIIDMVFLPATSNAQILDVVKTVPSVLINWLAYYC